MAAVADNLLIKDIQYAVEETANGIWRRYVYPNGQRFAEFKTHLKWGTMPLVHYTHGRCPDTGKRITAYGIIAVGRTASGIVAIGQMAFGLIAIGQLSIGVLLGLGQAAFGEFSLGQLALGVFFGAGQFATGEVAIGQFAFGYYVLAQTGWGQHVIDMNGIDPAQRNFS